MPTFFVTGATGRQGGSTARQLLDKGAKVNALVRDSNADAAKNLQSQGATLFEGDYLNAEVITRALEGVDGVFYNPPHPGPDAAKSNQIFMDTCIAHKDTFSTFVLSTAIGTDLHTETAKKDPNYPMAGYFPEKLALEERARSAGFTHLVILRPSVLVSNYFGWESELGFPELRQRKLITALRPDTKVPHLVAEDVGNFAVVALLEPSRLSGHEITLACENPTLSEIAGVLREVSGLEVDAPVATFDGDKAVGVTSPMSPFFLWANKVDLAVDVEALKSKYGIPLTSVKEYFEANKEELMKSLGS